MRQLLCSCGSLLLLLGFGAGLHGADEDRTLPAPLGTRIVDFSLPQAADGRPWSLVKDGRDAKAVVVLFLGTECPISNAYVPKLAALHKQYHAKGVVFLGINSNQQDDATTVAKHAKEFGIPFVVLKDQGAVVADRFHATRVPQVFLLDGSRTVRYRGRIDDQFGKSVRRPHPTKKDLIDALDAVLAGDAVARPVTEVVGCPISRPLKVKKAVPEGEVITYSKHVARVIQTKCQECHRPGEIGPFKLMTYKDAAAWADAIREVVAEHRMPPWHADPAHGKFVNDRRLSDSDQKTLLAWIDQGCPEGDAADLPPPRRYVQGWRIEHPDEIIQMSREMRVPAQAPKGGLPYEYVLAGKPLTEDKWVQASEIRPGNRGVLHHAIVYIMKPFKKPLPKPDASSEEISEHLYDDRSPDDTPLPDMMATFAPGELAISYPAGFAKRLPKGSQLVFELHYTPNGKAGTDRSSLGLVYAKEPPKHEVLGGMAITGEFRIPPLTKDHRVIASTTFDRDVMLLSMLPHMHLRGKSFEYRLVLPDGKEEILLSVPKYDFNWQTRYTLVEQRRLPKGSKIQCTAHYDNSVTNPNNPNPFAIVSWGDQTWDEMMIGFFSYHAVTEARPK
jgi:thiol-disulfide isomerase/thioredoxin